MMKIEMTLHLIFFNILDYMNLPHLSTLKTKNFKKNFILQLTKQIGVVVEYTQIRANTFIKLANLEK